MEQRLAGSQTQGESLQLSQSCQRHGDRAQHQSFCASTVLLSKPWPAAGWLAGSTGNRGPATAPTKCRGRNRDKISAKSEKTFMDVCPR